MEHKRPFTLNAEQSREIQGRILKKLAENWQQQQPPSTPRDANGEDLASLLDQLRRFGCSVIDYPADLRLLAQVLTYFEISVNRITDNVAMFIENEFISKLNEELKNKLSDNLGFTGVDGPARCAALVAGGADPQVEIDALQRKNIALTNALNTFQSSN
jgi:hypothetical protein